MSSRLMRAWLVWVVAAGFYAYGFFQRVAPSVIVDDLMLAFVIPTLLNANDTAPYSHDGQATGYAAVVDHFDAKFDLEFDNDAKRDLVACLEAVGHGKEPFEPQDLAFDRRETDIFACTLEASIAERDQAVVGLTVETIGRELREVRERWPDVADRQTRSIVADWILAIGRVGLAA